MKVDYEATDRVVIVDVTLEQAQWTLELVERLFDIFIVSPARDEAMIRAAEEMRRRARPGGNVHGG